ncbi:hypothetical protein HZA26_00220 [Candidatus Nomurabacteria bacterium]|nr:hypothetical protein [Candidatus Nomurabacteria bacterium]
MKKINIVYCSNLTLILVFVFASCGKVPAPSTTTGTFTDVYNTIKTANCMECHSPTGAAKVNSGVQLDFSTQTTSYSTLTNNHVVTATDIIGTCGTAKLVIAGSPDTSYLAAVLISKYNVTNFAGILGCTPYTVHLTDQHITDSDQSSIIDWIKNGALNN